MAEAQSSGRFSIDLPDSDAAIALAGAGQSTLHRLEALTGASIVLRGLNLEISGRSSQLERASAVIELMRPVWQEGQTVSTADVTAALSSIDNGREEEHTALCKQVLVRNQTGNLLRPRTLRQKSYLDSMGSHDFFVRTNKCQFF